MKKVFLVVVMFLLLGATHVFALSGDLVDQGVTTLDNETGLLWLDWSETSGMSYYEVTSSSWVTDGYRFATQEEIAILTAKFELPASTMDYSMYDSYREAIDLMGMTNDEEYIHPDIQTITVKNEFARVMYDPVVNGNSYSAAVAGLFSSRWIGRDNGIVYTYMASSGASVGVSDTVDVSQGHISYGWALVQDTGSLGPVPEPGTVLLLGAGLLGLLALRRKYTR